MRWFVLAGLFSALFSQSVAAQKLTGKRWIDMDYGPYLTSSIESTIPTKNIAQKGLAIRVGPEKNATVVFDTDLLRYSVGTVDGFINLRGVVFDGAHWAYPTIAGRQIFGTRYRPGWAKEGSFADPRTKYEGLGYGPLPHEHSRYKGLYLHGQRVILKYTVGETTILETPGWKSADKASAFTRTVNIGKSKKDLILSVLDHNGEVTLVETSKWEKAKPGAAIESTIAIQGELSSFDGSAKEPSGPSERGLIAHWKFDENKGEIASGTGGPSAKLQNASWTAGKQGSALTFKRGQFAIVEDSTKLNLGKDFTLTAWVKTRRGGTLLSKTVEGKWTHHGKSLFVRGGRLCFDVGWVGMVQSRQRINDGQWHHVALTHRSRDGMANLFIDGSSAATKILKSAPDPSGSQIRFGYTSKDFPDRGASLQGSLDEVRIYNRVLSVNEFGIAATKMGVAVSAQATSKGLTWKTNEGQLQLHIPASATPTKIEIAIGVTEGSSASIRKVLRFAKKPEDLTPLTKGGPARWKEKLKTKPKLGEGSGPYVADILTPPRKNPWNSWMRFGGFDFFKDGKRAAICTWSGDVWIVEGVDDLKELTWHRIATGMFQPLGLKIIKEQIYVCCRDQITRLHDLNEDGEIDFYESFNNDHQVTEHFHEFAMDLQTDSKGYLYYAKSARHARPPIVPHHGTLIKVTPDGKKSEIICNGFRAANGVGIGPNGELMSSDQEGHWMPANRINLVKSKGFYGNLFSYHGGKRQPKDGYDPPLCWLPKKVDRSPAEQLWVTSDKWGPLKGRMIHTSYGTGKIFLVMHETVDGVPQGGVVPIPNLRFPTGVMRARFHPGNGQLYVCGLVGWSSNCGLPGDFYRIRYTGKKAHLPVELKVKANGISLTFTDPLDKAAAEDVDSYSLEQWNYRWTKNYGSKHYRVSNPRRTGQDEVEVVSAKLSEDGRTIFLEIEDLKPVMQMKIDLDLKSKEGAGIKHTIHHTINRVPK